MREGTKKLFPTEYEDFKQHIIDAADHGGLPATLKLNEVRDFTLKDFQDMFIDFNLETSLEMTGSFYLCEDCGKLHLEIKIDQPKETLPRILQ